MSADAFDIGGEMERASGGPQMADVEAGEVVDDRSCSVRHLNVDSSLRDECSGGEALGPQMSGHSMLSPLSCEVSRYTVN